MKKFASLLVVMTFGVFVLSACSAVASAVEVPVPLQLLIKVGVEIAVVWVFTQLTKIGLELEGYRVQVVAAVAGAVLVLINQFLAKVPTNLESIVGALLNLLVVVLSSYGVAQLISQYKRLRAK